MSIAPTSTRPTAKRRRRLILVAVPVALLLGSWLALRWMADRTLHLAIAEADRLDPKWRFEDVEAGRVALPDAENSALAVVHILGQVPRSWPMRRTRALKPGSPE